MGPAELDDVPQVVSCLAVSYVFVQMKGVVLPNMHKPCLGEVYDPRGFNRTSLQSLSRQVLPGCFTLLYLHLRKAFAY